MKVTYRTVFGIVVCIVVLALVLLPSIQRAREAACRNRYKENLEQIAVGLHAYHDEFQCFPPAHVRGPDGKRWHSWRVLLLPYVDQQELYEQYDFSEPWDGPNNSQLLDAAPDVYCYSRHKWTTDPETNVLAVVGKRAAWPADQSLRLRDINDGSSNTISLVESKNYSTAWSSPIDSSPHKVFEENGDHGRYIVMADGTVRFPTGELEDSMLVSLLTPRNGMETYKGDWPKDLEEPVIEINQPQVDLASVDGVSITPVQTTPIKDGRTLLWCATFQMAWDEMRRAMEVNELKEVDPNRTIATLNSSAFPLTDLAEESYSLETSHDPNERTCSVHTTLRKQMPFKDEFTRMEKPLVFTNQPVHNFGEMPEENGLGEPRLMEQVRVLDYVSDDDFIIQLNTISDAGDEIILARITQPESLQAGLQHIRERIETSNQWHDRPSLMTGDTLLIPVLSFHFIQRFQELVNQNVVVNSDILTIQEASQSIFLSLNEKGAEVLSSADIIIGEFGDEPARPVSKPRKLIFDEPFLMILKEKEASEPYFIGWIGNIDLMEAW